MIRWEKFPDRLRLPYTQRAFDRTTSRYLNRVEPNRARNEKGAGRASPAPTISPELRGIGDLKVTATVTGLLVLAGACFLRGIRGGLWPCRGGGPTARSRA